MITSSTQRSGKIINLRAERCLIYGPGWAAFIAIVGGELLGRDGPVCAYAEYEFINTIVGSSVALASFSLAVIVFFYSRPEWQAAGLLKEKGMIAQERISIALFRTVKAGFSAALFASLFGGVLLEQGWSRWMYYRWFSILPCIATIIYAFVLQRFILSIASAIQTTKLLKSIVLLEIRNKDTFSK